MTTDPTPLHVIVITSDVETVKLVEGIMKGVEADELIVATDLAEGLARASSEAPDLVLVEVAMGGNAGLAVVHHVRALSPGAAVYALARQDELELGTQAVALGGTGLLMLPLSGDELLSALTAVRTRVAERQLRESLEREVAVGRITDRMLEGLEGLPTPSTRSGAARQVLEVMQESTASKAGAVLLRASEASRELLLTCSVGDLPALPTFCEEMEVMSFAKTHGLSVVRLATRASQQGILVLGGSPQRAAILEAALSRASAPAATWIALAGERESVSRGTMKDPESSAYTFAYFVDVAGREIDKARRHGRRFALATLSIGDAESEKESGTTTLQVAELVLHAVRDTDVLARVDEGEFYLLLPETGGIGAHSCRRRVTRELRATQASVPLSIGVATFPHDGGDLSQLMRVARHRADRSRESIVFKMGLDRLPLDEVLDTLLWTTHDDAGVELPRVIELPRSDILTLATTAIREARRSGSAWAVATQHGGLGVAAAARAALGKESEALELVTVDVTKVPRCRDLELLSLVTEHGAYTLLGRIDRDVVRAVHSADPLFADLIVERLGETLGTRLSS